MVLEFSFVSSLFHFLYLLPDPYLKLQQDVTGYEPNSLQQRTAVVNATSRGTPCAAPRGTPCAAQPLLGQDGRLAPLFWVTTLPAAFPPSGAAQRPQTSLKVILLSTFTVIFDWVPLGVLIEEAYH